MNQSIPVPDKRQITKKAKNLLKEGLSRQETYEKLIEEYKYGKIVADVVEQLPSKKAWQKYKKWNYVLLSLLISITTIYVLSNLAIVVIALYVISIYIVAFVKTRYYPWIFALTMFEFIIGIGVFLSNETNTIIWINVIILLLIHTPCLILSLWIPKKICPSPIKSKELFKNNKGDNRMRVVYKFLD